MLWEQRPHWWKGERQAPGAGARRRLPEGQVLLRAQPDRQEGTLRPPAARSQGARQPVGLHVKAVGMTRVS